MDVLLVIKSYLFFRLSYVNDSAVALGGGLILFLIMFSSRSDKYPCNTAYW